MTYYQCLTGIPIVIGKVSANTITQTGFYVVLEDKSNQYDFPVNPNGVMSVENYDSGIVRQMYSNYAGYTWVRMCWYGTWQGWRNIA